MSRSGNQKGAALLMTLLLLFMITVIVATTAVVGTFQLRMARSTLNNGMAFVAAENASNILLNIMLKNEGCDGVTDLYQSIMADEAPTCNKTALSGTYNGMTLSWSATASETYKDSTGTYFQITITGEACDASSNCIVNVREQGYGLKKVN